MTNTQVQYWSLVESKRNNKAQLREQSRHNKETERLTGEAQSESQRSNLAREALTRAAQAETARSNLVTEARESARLAETSRANRAKEANDLLSISVAGRQADTSAYLASETARANRARELETNRSNISSEEIRRSLGNAQQAETVRHNYATERNQLITSGTGSLINAAGRIIPSFLRR